MRLWVISDLHISLGEARMGTTPRAPMPEADVAIVAGDICEGVEDAIGWLARTITLRMPVVFVLGNHEFYGEYIGEARRVAAAYASRTSGLHLLDDSSIVIDGVRFLGCTLWTDYDLYSGGDRAERLQAMRHASTLLDHKQILMEPERPEWIAPDFTPRDARDLHQASVSWLDAELAKPHEGPTVVVSHHAPHPGSVARRFEGDPQTPAFVSDLSSLIDRHQPQLWAHGHTHTSFDYTVHPLDGRPTRVVCNPRGWGDENTVFDWGMVVEV